MPSEGGQASLERPQQNELIAVTIQKARDDVRRMIEGVNAGEFPGILAAVPDSIARFPKHFVRAALAEMELDPAPVVKALLASLVLCADQLSPSGMVDRDHYQRAEEVLLAAFESDNADLRWSTATHFAYCVHPSPRVIRQLIRMLDDQDESTQIVSAAALFKVLGNTDEDRLIGPHASRLVRLLRKGIRSDHYLSATLAARALERVDRAECCAAMIDALAAAPAPDQQYHVLEALEVVGGGSDPAKEALFEYFHDESRPKRLRATAARTLARIIDPEEAHTLLYVLRKEDDDLIKGVLQGLALRPKVTELLVHGIVSTLGDNDADVRSAALRALVTIPGAPKAALSALLDRVGVELHFAVVDELASALVAVGDEVAPAMIEKIRNLNIASLMVASLVLGRLGTSGAKALVSAMRTDSEPWFRAILMASVRDMGESTAVVVGQLGDALLATAEDDPAKFIAQAIANTGRAALAALPALVQVATTRTGEVAAVAELAIRNIGPDVIGPLRDAMASLPVGARISLENRLQWVPPIEPKLLKRLDKVGTRDLLRYLLACDFLLDHAEKSVGSRDLAKQLVDNEIAREQGVTMERASIQRAFSKIQQHLAGGRPLLVKGALTGAAKGVLGQARQYLSMKGVVPRFRGA